MEARTLGPFLPTNKRPSTAATNESEFFIHRISRAPQPQQPCTAEQFVGRAAKKQASEPPAETHWGKEKQRMGGTSTSMACKHTRKKQALPQDKQPTMFSPNTKPAPPETQHAVPQHCKRNPTNPNQKRKPLLSMILPQVHLR